LKLEGLCYSESASEKGADNGPIFERHGRQILEDRLDGEQQDEFLLAFVVGLAEGGPLLSFPIERWSTTSTKLFASTDLA
jgi:hypothetical protein